MDNTDHMDSTEHHACGHSHGSYGANISEPERLASLVGGGALALFGLSRRSLGGLGLAALGGGLLYRGITRHCHMYEKLGISTAEEDYDAHYDSDDKDSEAAARRAKHTHVEHGIVVEKSITINRPRAEVYAFWRKLENLPKFMSHLESVDVIDDKHSKWTARAPLGAHVAWDAEITNEREGEMIAWRSLPDSDVHNTGSVRFHDAVDGSGTEVKVVFQYDPPGSAIGAVFARLFGEEPSQQVEEDLQRFKQIMEGDAVAAGQ